MKLEEKLLNPHAPVILFEMVPPPVGKPESVERTVEEIKRFRPLFDAVNLPEIHDESRGQDRTFKFIERMDPRSLGARILRECETEVIVNRCVVYAPDQTSWLKHTREEFGIRQVVLVGGESSEVHYPGPSVLETAEEARAAGLPISLGGITIPSRSHEAERIRKKARAGITFYTSQVLFDSNDIVGLIHRLNGLEARLFLSFAPVSDPRDIEFLRWLGADIPRDLDRFLLHHEQAEEKEATEAGILDRSLDLAQRILMNVFDNLPPDPPPIGINIEHINRRNFAPAIRLLERLGDLYTGLVAARARGSLA